MKRIKFTLICTAALTLALSFTGCMHGDSGSTTKKNVEQQIETQLDDNGNCPDDKCPEGECPENGGKNGECPNGNCPEKGNNIGRRPVRLLPPHGRHGDGNGRIAPLPRPHKGN